MRETQTQEAGPLIHTKGRAGLSQDNATGNYENLLTKESQVRPNGEKMNKYDKENKRIISLQRQ